MRDHHYNRESGERVPIQQMTDTEIAEALRDGIQLDTVDEVPCTVQDVLERLRIEQIIRTYNLRSNHAC